MFRVTGARPLSAASGEQEQIDACLGAELDRALAASRPGGDLRAVPGEGFGGGGDVRPITAHQYLGGSTAAEQRAVTVADYPPYAPGQGGFSGQEQGMAVSGAAPATGPSPVGVPGLVTCSGARDGAPGPLADTRAECAAGWGVGAGGRG